MTKVIVLGDSYINRLQDKGCPNLQLATSDIRVRFAGKSGGNVSSMQRELVPQAFVYKPEIISMHIGANDLTSSLINPNRLAVHIVSLAEYALTGIDELNYVVIGSSIRRTRRSAKYFSDDLSLAEYKVRIGELNDALELAIVGVILLTVSDSGFIGAFPIINLGSLRWVQMVFTSRHLDLKKLQIMWELLLLILEGFCEGCK